MWKITDAQGRETALAELQAYYPNLVCFNESSWQVYFPDDYMDVYSSGRLYFWENKKAALNSDGWNAIATADWEDKEDDHVEDN